MYEKILILSFLVSLIIWTIYNFLSSYFIYIWILSFIVVSYFFKKKKILENFTSIINCKQNSTCNLPENNYNQFPDSIKNIAKESANYYKKKYKKQVYF